MKLRQNPSGFSLIELMIALALSSVIMMIIFTIYTAQVRGQISQDMLVDMQQGARTALEIMGKEIRMARCNGNILSSAGASITQANPGRLSFTMDVKGDSNAPEASDGDILDEGESVSYALTNDANFDGRPDGYPCDLGRQDNNGTQGMQPLVENVDALNFVYMDGNGNPLPATVPPGSTNQIQRIEITFVVRSGEKLPGLVKKAADSNTYSNQQNAQILTINDANKDFRRIQYTMNVWCRNQ